MPTECRFCGARELRVRWRGVVHPRKRDHGPFDLYACRACGSLGTAPLPSKDALAALYGSFASGVDATLRTMRAASPLTAWFEQVVRHTARAGAFSRDRALRWIDVGAGGGELAAALARAYPNSTGLALDWSTRPDGLDARVAWQLADLNEPLPDLAPVDLVISLSVWEHVLDPAAFAQRLLPLVAPGGLLYLVCPDAGSLAARVLGARWPYFLPGEHLHVPTLAGARRCIERAGARAVIVERVGLPYPPAYVLGYLGVDAPWARRLPAVPLPVGALAAIVRRP